MLQLEPFKNPAIEVGLKLKLPLLFFTLTLFHLYVINLVKQVSLVGYFATEWAL